MKTLLATWKDPGKAAVEAAWASAQRGGDLRTCLEDGLAKVELDPAFIAIGLGSLPNADGELELDAAMMDGKDLSAGAVCAVRQICPAISVARKVMEETPHVMLAGEHAKRFAIAKGFQPINLMTPENIRHYDNWRHKPEDEQREYIHSVAEHHGDTVTMLGWESPDHVVAASATSGLAWKLPGRVGDSPIIGAGIYADDEIGCAGATGWGEELWRGVASFRVVENMRAGMSPQEACDATIRHMMRRQPIVNERACVVLGMNNKGEFAAACTATVFHLWSCQDGKIDVREYQPLNA